MNSVQTFCSRNCLVFVVTSAMTVACATACRSGPRAPASVSADTWATVDDRAITKADVENAYRRTRDTTQPLSDEEVQTDKLTVLGDLILQDILLARARTLSLDVPQGDVDAAYNDAKKNVADDTFASELKRRGLTPDDLREGLRRDLLADKVVAQAVGGKITPTEQEITDAFTANRAQFNVAEESYRVAQLVVTPVRDAQVGNASGDDATTPAEALTKVQMLMERLKAGASFADLAIGYSEDPESAPRGGDLGLVPVSRLQKMPPALRDTVLNKAPGAVNVANTGDAYALVLVIAHEQPGQRDLSVPAVRTQITNMLRTRKEQLQRAAYVTTVREDADVVNYMARRLAEAKATTPASDPKAK